MRVFVYRKGSTTSQCQSLLLCIKQRKSCGYAYSYNDCNFKPKLWLCEQQQVTYSYLKDFETWYQGFITRQSHITASTVFKFNLEMQNPIKIVKGCSITSLCFRVFSKAQGSVQTLWFSCRCF